MKKYFTRILCMLVVASLAISCSDDDSGKGKTVTAFAPIASTSFGESESDLEAAETAAGRTVAPYDRTTRTLHVNTGDADYPSIVYYFDANDRYRYAMVAAAAFELLSSGKMQEALQKGGWKAYPTTIATDDEKLYDNGSTLLRLFAKQSPRQSTPAMLVGRLDESMLAWTRTRPLADDATGMEVPLAAFGASRDLIGKYELLQGHTINTERTNPGKQFYAYDTGDARFPMMGYWFDVTTDTFLEECAIYVDPESRPTPAEADTYVRNLGFEDSSLKDSDGNYLYYLAAEKTVCLIEMNQPQTGNFSPKLRFYEQDLTDYLPKGSVDIPWPNMEFGKITMAEAEAWYTQKGYKLGTNPDLGLPEVTTDSQDFPKILLLEDGGYYAGAYVMTSDEKVILSPDVTAQLLENGFVYIEGGFLPTYHNTKTGVEAQIDTSAIFGAYAIAFNLIGA